MVSDDEISKCDVCDREKLKKFRKKLGTWHEWLLTDDHSIWRQIHFMIWNDMIFRTINECRRLNHKNPSPNVGFNRDVATFIDEGYVAKQLLAIRRLTETDRRGGAITIPRLLDDMRDNANLFTREIYVCHKNGLPFDPEPARQRHLRKLTAEAEKNNGATFTRMDTEGPKAYDMASLAHETFDRLMGAVGKSRSRNDTLDTAFFDQIKSKLGFSSEINRVASKFIAHAADAGSRGQLDNGKHDITLARIAACQRIICRVAAYIRGPLLQLGCGGLVPTPQYNQLEHLEKGWLDPANLEILGQYWDERAAKIEKWIEGDWDTLLNLRD